MKNIIFFCMLLALLSCNERLIEIPKSFVSPVNFYNNDEDAKIAIMGVYDMLGSRKYQNGNYGHGLHVVRLAGTDEATVRSVITNSLFTEISDYTLSSTSFYSMKIWESSYVAINRANSVIDNLSESEKISDEIKSIILGEARFLRALHYFNLVQLFGMVPLTDHETVSENGIKLPRSPISDVYGLIIEDLTFAEGALPLDWDNSNIGRATKGAAKAYLAKVYLTMAGNPLGDKSKYPLAASKAKEVIDLNQYSLLPAYGDVFEHENENNAEVIFDVQFTEDDPEETGTLTGFVGPTGPHSGGGSFNMIVPTIYLINSYNPNDSRFLRNIAQYRVNSVGDHISETTKDKFRVGKWNKPANPSYAVYSSPYNVILMRYSDVLLLYAEALNEANSGPTAEGYNAINQVRARARGENTDPSLLPSLGNLSQSDFREAIYNERLWELAFEGHRWFDLVRWGKLIENVKLAGFEAENYNSRREVFAADNISEFNKLYPIPLIELGVNDQIEQNTGY